jgi:hypothetical protein
MPKPQYGYPHKKLRAQWKVKVEAGSVDCARCGLPIEPDALWDLGHADEDPSQYSGPEHRACNRATLTHARNKSVALYEWF